MMLKRFLQGIIIKLLKLNGDVLMMALFLAQSIVLGKIKFDQVPNTLKVQVYEILVESGLEDLADGYKPPTPVEGN